MNTKLYIYWATSQAAAAYLLLGRIDDGPTLLAFLAAHAVAVGTTLLACTGLLSTVSGTLPRLHGRAVVLFFSGLSVIPLAGPATALFVGLFLRYFTLYPVRSESFRPVNRDILRVLRRQSQARTLPVTEALLVRGLDREDAVRSVAVIGEMAWAPAKASILRYMIRLSPYPNVVLMAIDLLQKKQDALLGEIMGLLADPAPGAETLKRIANLYHEVDYLDLCDPLMKSFYRDKACEYARRAFEAGGRSEAYAVVRVRYLLAADRVAQAYAVYEQIRSRGDYFFPQWIAYEMEFAVRRNDRETFENLDLLIGSGGGVFIPERVKAACQAWKRVLTSAWL